MIWAILHRTRPAYELAGTPLFAWNPQVLFETAGNGHNDMLMTFFTLLAVYLLVRKKWEWVLPALVIAILVKYVMVLLLLAFLIYCWKAQASTRSQVNFVAKTMVICLLLAVVVVRF